MRRDSARSNRWKFWVVASLVTAATTLHYVIDVRAGATHDLLLRSYYLPIVLAGLWFGVRGGLATSALVSLVFFPHAIHGWDAPYTFVFRLSEILMYNIIGGLTGFMSQTTAAALNAETKARLERETAYEDLRSKTQALFDAEERLRRSERLAALGRMSAGLAHEIRNPLSSIKTSVELLYEQSHDPIVASQTARESELMEILANETARLDRFLSRFLTFTRFEVELTREPHEEACLGAVVTETLTLLRTELESREVEIVTDLTISDARVRIGVDVLKQVLLNLLLNAADAMPGGGQIRVHGIEENVDSLTFSVEDDGAGISDEDASAIFDPFYSTKPDGSGLGLSIVSRLLESSGGHVALDPNYECGARFVVTILRS